MCGGGRCARARVCECVCDARVCVAALLCTGATRATHAHKSLLKWKHGQLCEQELWRKGRQGW